MIAAALASVALLSPAAPDKTPPVYCPAYCAVEAIAPDKPPRAAVRAANRAADRRWICRHLFWGGSCRVWWPL